MFISVEAVRWVLTESQSERSSRLVLIAIAAHCNEDGCCWPGMEAIMRYTRLSKPIVLKAMDELTELGELRIEKGGRGAGDTNHYFLPAFMQGRVNKGIEKEDKGKVPALEGYIRVDPNKNLEQEVIEQAAAPQYFISFLHWSIEESQKQKAAGVKISADQIRREVKQGIRSYP